MAMFVIPTLSLIIPAIEPRIKGTASANAVPRMNEIGTAFPAANHPNIEVIARKPKKLESHVGVFLLFNAEYSEKLEIRAIMTPKVTPRVAELTTMGSS